MVQVLDTEFERGCVVQAEPTKSQTRYSDAIRRHFIKIGVEVGGCGGDSAGGD